MYGTHIQKRVKTKDLQSLLFPIELMWHRDSPSLSYHAQADFKWVNNNHQICKCIHVSFMSTLILYPPQKWHTTAAGTDLSQQQTTVLILHTVPVNLQLSTRHKLSSQGGCRSCGYVTYGRGRVVDDDGLGGDLGQPTQMVFR